MAGLTISGVASCLLSLLYCSSLVYGFGESNPTTAGACGIDSTKEMECLPQGAAGLVQQRMDAGINHPITEESAYESGLETKAWTNLAMKEENIFETIFGSFHGGQAGNVADEPKVRLFYNVFMGANQTLATSIVKEQMSTLQGALPTSFAVDFTTIGRQWDKALIDASGLGCSTCHHRAHYNEGWETVTLQSLYEYCTQHPTKQVAYMHNKGSFHPSEGQDNLRHLLMKGIVSQECVHMPAKCSVCSSRFSPIPHPHTPGNMWHAKCSHIQRLLPPATFGATMEDFFTYQAGDMEIYPWDDQGPSNGFGRYSNEHWVHSHPDTEPCDVYAGKLPHLVIGIRWPLWKYENFWTIDNKKVWPITAVTSVKWARLRCLEWNTVYGKLPTNFSMWRFEETLQKIAHMSSDAVGRWLNSNCGLALA